jgi:hypothetical protein
MKKPVKPQYRNIVVYVALAHYLNQAQPGLSNHLARHCVSSRTKIDPATPSQSLSSKYPRRPPLRRVNDAHVDEALIAPVPT